MKGKEKPEAGWFREEGKAIKPFKEGLRYGLAKDRVSDKDWFSAVLKALPPPWLHLNVITFFNIAKIIYSFKKCLQISFFNRNQ